VPCLKAKNSKNLNRTPLSFEYKSCRALLGEYFFVKADLCFSQRFLHKLQPNFECHSMPVNRSCWQLTRFSTLFHPKLEMPSNMKVESLEKLDNFHMVRFWSVQVKFGERGKSSGGHSKTLGFR
jgi:hypothetical protein